MRIGFYKVNKFDENRVNSFHQILYIIERLKNPNVGRKNNRLSNFVQNLNFATFQEKHIWTTGFCKKTHHSVLWIHCVSPL